jgi:hypothetical protein
MMCFQRAQMLAKFGQGSNEGGFLRKSAALLYSTTVSNLVMNLGDCMRKRGRS